MRGTSVRRKPSAKLARDRGKCNRTTRATGGLVGTAECVELHQKGEKTVRQALR
jgi:hypothetical protein